MHALNEGINRCSSSCPPSFELHSCGEERNGGRTLEVKRSMRWFPAPDHLCPTLGRKNFGVRVRIWSPPKEAVSGDTNSIQDEPWRKCTVRVVPCG